MSRLPTKEELANWTPHDDPYDAQRLQVKVKPRDHQGRHRVEIRCNGIRFDDVLDVFDSFKRKKCREAAVSKCQLPDDAHEDIETKLLAGAELADSQGDTATKPEVVRMADVQPEQVEWLWPGRIAVGKVTLFAGNPGLGKSLATLDIAARVTAGKCWPDNRWEQQQVGGVVLLSAEDDLGDTIRPRLDSHGADVSRIVALKSIQGSDGEGDYKRSFDLCRDIDHLRAAIGTVENCRLVVVDPISAYMGKTDSHKNADVRSVLTPLAELASETRVAVLAVSHLRKGEGAAIYRTMGSLAFVAAARACWVVTEDSADKRRRLLLPTKNNLSDDTQGLAFRIEAHGPDGSPVVCWEAEPITVSADEAMGSHGPKRGPAPDDRKAAAEWLREQLASGPMLAKEVVELGDDLGFTKRTLQRAYRELGGTASRQGFGGPVNWSLPIRANVHANTPRDSQPGTYGDTWRDCENPEEQQQDIKFLRKEEPYMPSSERQAQLDAFEAEQLECNGHGDVPF